MDPNVLRALVFEAYDRRGAAEFGPACAAIVDSWERWPLVEALPAIHEAGELLERRRADLATAIELMRASYGSAR